MPVYTLTIEWGGGLEDQNPALVVVEAPDPWQPVCRLAEILSTYYGPGNELYDFEADPAKWAQPGVLFHGDLSAHLAGSFEVIRAAPLTPA